MWTRGILIPIAVFLITVSLASGQTPLDAAFTYQGRLESAGQPFSGPSNLEFRLYDASAGGNLIGTQALNGVAVIDGLFTVQLNAERELGGDVFQGETRWLEVSVNGTTLLPRQELTAVPHAAFAMNAGRLNDQPGAYFLNASNMNGGTLSDDRLSSNVCLLNREQVFTDEKHFAARPTFDSPTIPFTVESNTRIPNLNADLLDGLDSTALRQWGVASNHIYSTNTGNVGIGTATPVSKLSVQGGLHLFDDLDEDVVFHTSNYSIRETDNQHLAYRYMSDPEQHDFCIAGNSQVMIASSGNVGIGTTDPTALLHLKPRVDQSCIRMEADRYVTAPDSLARSNATVTQISGVGAAWANAAQAGSLNGVSATAVPTTPGTNEETRELDFRNLGFNLPADAVIRGVRVQVTGAGSGSCSECGGPYAHLEYVKTARLANGATLGAIRANRSQTINTTLGNTNDFWGLPLTPAIVNSANFGVRLRVRLIPVTTYYDYVHPNGMAVDCPGCDATANIGIDGITVTISYGAPTLTHAEYTVGIGLDGADFRISPSPDFSVDSFAINPAGIVNIGPGQGILLNVFGGAAKNGGGSWASTSDIRLKCNIAPLEGTLDRLLTLHGYSFDYTADAIARKHGRPGRQMGLIAQEVQQVFPDWIDYTPDGYRMVTERATTALLVEALRDLRAEKDRQLAERDARIADLSARLERLEAALSQPAEH